MMKSVLVIAGYSGGYGYGLLIMSSGGQALVLAALNGLKFSSTTVGRVLALPGALIHRGQYYERLVVGACRKLGGDILRVVSNPNPAGIKRRKPHDEEPCMIDVSSEGAAEKIDMVIREKYADLELLARSRQADGMVKEHDMWHCITAALSANVLGDCKHDHQRRYTPRAGETVEIVGTGTNIGRALTSLELVVAMVGSPLDRLLACGVNVNMVVRTTGCMDCVISACKKIGYRYIVS